MGRIAVIGLLGLGACKFAPNITGDGGGGSDVITIDAPIVVPPCEGQSAECVESSLVTCENATSEPEITTCSAGCVGSGPSAHCAVIDPTGDVTEGDLVAETGRDAVTLSDGAVIDSTNGTISGASGFTVRDAGGVTIFKFKSLTINGAISLVGDRPIALVAQTSIVINGLLDGRGCTGSLRTAGPGGFEGGAATDPGAGPGGGGGGNANDNGGGGGGHGAGGGVGTGGLAGGNAYGTESLAVLTGGSGGGGGKSGGGNGGGGGGGGGVQLVSNGTIEIGPTAGINMGGCGGGESSGGSQDGGGGGGAGGAILLEAPAVSIAGTLAANGGGGGNRTAAGTSGELSNVPAEGAGNAGSGGAGANPGGFPAIGGMGAAGGGAVGRIRINTRTGVATAGSSIVSPAASQAIAPIQ